MLLGSVCILLLSGLAALAYGKSFSRSTALGAGGTVLACAASIYPATYTLLTGTTVALNIPWNMPFGSFNVALDSLSALFLLPLLLLSAMAAIYGAQYLKSDDGGAIGVHWFFFNLCYRRIFIFIASHNS